MSRLFVVRIMKPLCYRVFIKYCVFFPRILGSLPPLPRQQSTAIGCSDNRSDCKAYTRIELRALKVSYIDVGEGGVKVNCEKTQFFPEHPVNRLISSNEY